MAILNIGFLCWNDKCLKNCQKSKTCIDFDLLIFILVYDGQLEIQNYFQAALILKNAQLHDLM